MSNLIIGTAGHIDHGKTALVRALTGVDTDRLKEEKERGLTIDIGFAHIEGRATIIDVPGHEKFIRNMVAGVSSIDLVLFVVAADDGVMPQTREHLDILKLLQVKTGVIAITKSDLVDDEWRGLVRDDVQQLVQGSFLANAPVHFVSSVTGHGIADLKTEMLAAAEGVKRNQDTGLFWMPVDRAFSVKGFGTVVTGSVLSGALALGETVETLPEKRVCRVRTLQCQGKSVKSVSAGDRAALNLQALDLGAIGRGDVVASPDYFSASSRFDVSVRLLDAAPQAVGSGTRVRVHIGTAEIMARMSIVESSKLEPGQEGYAQLHLERPATARRFDPFVLRRYSPTVTIGGGRILNADAPRRKLSSSDVLTDFHNMEKQDPAEALEVILLSAGFFVVTIENLASRLAVVQDVVLQLMKPLATEQRIVSLKKRGRPGVAHKARLDLLNDECLRLLQKFHERNPFRTGIAKRELMQQIRPAPDRELFDLVVDLAKSAEQVKETEGLLSLSSYKIKLSEQLESLKRRIEALLLEEEYNTSSESAMARKLDATAGDLADVLGILVATGAVIRVEADVFFHVRHVDAAREKLLAFLAQNGEISIGQFKELINGASRKYAMPLINYFDQLGITMRTGDVRVLQD